MFNEIDHKSKWIIFLIITNLFTVSFCLYFLFVQVDEQVEIIPDKMIVQIAGEVNNPDLYEIETGTRLNQLIEMAGGFTDDADTDAINLAILLTDEMKITVPNINDETLVNKININTADKETLMELNGIGEVKAQDIINYREANGPFKTIEELLFVKGIGGKTFENIKDFICC